MALMVTKELAYVLGFTWADGWIRKTKYHHEIRVECVRDDIEELYNVFLQTGKWNKYFRNRSGRKPQARLNLCHEELVNTLLECDYSAKSYKSADKILQLIPEKFHSYWFRGLIDGDGCWYVNKTKHKRQFSLTSSAKQDWHFFERLLKQLDIKYRKNNSVNSCSRIEITGKDNFEKLGNYLYSSYVEDKVGLMRKYDKWNDIMNSYVRK